MRIVRLANFVTPSSGGLRTALRELGQGYAAAGHEPVLVTPGPRHTDELTPQGRVITVPGPLVPGLGGYRVLLNKRKVARLLSTLEPDRLEVSDRTTLRWTGRWARRHGVPSVMVSHESLAGLLGVARLPHVIREMAAVRLNHATAKAYDRILCTTAWAAAEFRATRASNVVEVPLGVDLDLFHPSRREEPETAEAVLVCCTRLSIEKRPQRAITTLATLLAEGVKARLVVAGEGPLRTVLEREAQGLPVTFTGWIHDRERLADLLASADVVVAPGPIETFGLAALEALACGTPVVASESSALPAVIGEGGLASPGEDFSEAVQAILAGDRAAWRFAARARAEKFGWDNAVKGFLAVHEALS